MPATPWGNLMATADFVSEVSPTQQQLPILDYFYFFFYLSFDFTFAKTLVKKKETLFKKYKKEIKRKMSDTQKDAIILHLREIIRELEQEKKYLYKRLGFIYRPKSQPELDGVAQSERDGAGDDPNGGTGETKGGASDAM
jgi:hypothetical protein